MKNETIVCKLCKHSIVRNQNFQKFLEDFCKKVKNAHEEAETVTQENAEFRNLQQRGIKNDISNAD